MTSPSLVVREAVSAPPELAGLGRAGGRGRAGRLHRRSTGRRGRAAGRCGAGQGGGSGQLEKITYFHGNAPLVQTEDKCDTVHCSAIIIKQEGAFVQYLVVIVIHARKAWKCHRMNTNQTERRRLFWAVRTGGLSGKVPPEKANRPIWKSIPFQTGPSVHFSGWIIT